MPFPKCIYRYTHIHMSTYVWGVHIHMRSAFPNVHIRHIHIQGNEGDSSRGVRRGLHWCFCTCFSLSAHHTHAYTRESGWLFTSSCCRRVRRGGRVSLCTCFFVYMFVIIYSVHVGLLSVCRALLSGYRALFACVYVLGSWMRACVCMWESVGVCRWCECQNHMCAGDVNVRRTRHETHDIKGSCCQCQNNKTCNTRHATQHMQDNTSKEPDVKRTTSNTVNANVKTRCVVSCVRCVQVMSVNANVKTTCVVWAGNVTVKTRSRTCRKASPFHDSLRHFHDFQVTPSLSICVWMRVLWVCACGVVRKRESGCGASLPDSLRHFHDLHVSLSLCLSVCACWWVWVWVCACERVCVCA